MNEAINEATAQTQQIQDAMDREVEKDPSKLLGSGDVEQVSPEDVKQLVMLWRKIQKATGVEDPPRAYMGMRTKGGDLILKAMRIPESLCMVEDEVEPQIIRPVSRGIQRPDSLPSTPTLDFSKM